MRTRNLNKMTNAEVESYLERNDVIFIPVGTVETHGLFPVDIETTMPEGICSVLAEKGDGLFLTGLPYFFCGATTEARASVQMSICAGLDYLMELAHSLLRQGFRRQVYIGGHGPAFLTLATLCNDFFHETGVPIAQMDHVGMPKLNLAPNSRPDMSAIGKMLHTRILGSYRVLGKLDEILIDPEVKAENSVHVSPFSDDETGLYNYIFNFGPLSGQVGFYQNRPQCHGGFIGALSSREELEELSIQGEKDLRESIDEVNITAFLDTLRALDRETNENTLKRYTHLPARK